MEIKIVGHFWVFFLVLYMSKNSSLFLFIANRFFGFSIGTEQNWCVWIITGWLFIFILHFIKIYITDRFMNKKWEREQIDRLVALQQKRISQLESSINENPDNKI